MSERPVRGLWLEDLTEGLIIDHAIRRTITEADNTFFSAVTMNPAALHLDHHYAETQTEFGRPLVNSMLTLAMVVGISVHETTMGTTVANLGFQSCTFPKPLFHGDTLRCESEVTAARRSTSRPGQGIVTFEHRAFNQHDDVVCVAVRDALMLSRP